MTSFLAADPHWSGPGFANDEALNHWNRVPGYETGETTFARLEVPPPYPRLSGPAPMLTGVPDSKRAMPESSHPPASALAARLAESRKNGNL